ncbi:MAG: cysteine desulfurase NifS [Verrucomicrobiales bacterium]|nr:cysteine desulfurase NifS [Verrucomicrobiales bacterium]
MSPSATGAKPVLLGKCHFPVTFLAISKCDICASVGGSKAKSNLDPNFGPKSQTIPSPRNVESLVRGRGFREGAYLHGSPPEQETKSPDQNLNISSKCPNPVLIMSFLKKGHGYRPKWKATPPGSDPCIHPRKSNLDPKSQVLLSPPEDLAHKAVVMLPLGKCLVLVKKPDISPDTMTATVRAGWMTDQCPPVFPLATHPSLHESPSIYLPMEPHRKTHSLLALWLSAITVSGVSCGPITMTEQKFYYFDNNATTRVAPEVVQEMLPFLTEYWGNPSSAYGFGNRVAKFIEKARGQVATLINADPKEIVFTSCGTESNNSAIHSALTAFPTRKHVITTAVEHSANINFCEFLQKRGYEITLLPVETDGSIDIHLLEKSIRPDTAIVSVMWANNETGVIFPVEEIAAICRSKGVLFHTDATQVPGKLKIDVKSIGCDFLTLSAHKLHAPKGIGLLYIKRRTKYFPYIIGGHQERGKRGGTENVANIVAFGKAAELALAHLEEENTRVRALRDKLESAILKSLPNTFRNGAKEPRLPNTTNIAFEFVEAEAILLKLDLLGICASSGSACTTGSLDPSHVLTAMGMTPMRARGCVRFSLGIYNTEAEIDYLLKHLPPIIQELRSISPLNPEHPDNTNYDIDSAREKHESDLKEALAEKD